MSVAPGTIIGSYRVHSKLGEGGMGEVYRATDTRLGRDVALKVLPDDVAGNPDRLARFEREAQALAALNHFNIAQVYGFEGRALVMELLEGETLRDRLAGGPLPVRKAIDYGAQIARGLAAAHDRGIIHRDLKPENIFIVTDGHLKILDFGLARRTDDLHDAETQTAHKGTAPGTVLGTAGYMSPEQVRGQIVDARSDLFSLGAVLYEMLTGARAFRRDSSAETMAAILNDHPRELLALRADVSPALDRIVQHCLEKNPVERFQSARDIAFALDSLSGSGSSAAGVPPPARFWTRERAAWAALTAGLVAAMGWMLIARQTAPAPPMPVTRTLLVLPDGIAINELSVLGSRVAISPDGSRLAFQGRHVSGGRTQLFLTPLDGGPTLPLPGTEGAANQFWSPDSRQIGFTVNGTLMRLPLDGSHPVQVARDVTQAFTSGTWSTGGVVLLGGLPLHRVSLQDGSVTAALDGGKAGYAFPHFLADGQRFLFGTLNDSGVPAAAVGRLGSAETQPLMTAADLGKFVYADGAVVYPRGPTLFAQRADGDQLRLVGEPVAVGGPIDPSPTRGGAFSVSNNGVLVYQAAAPSLLRLTWLDRRGTVLSTVGEDGDYSNVELDPSGRRALVTIRDPRQPTRDVFVVDLGRGVRQRLTLDPSDERSAIWSPDGTRVLYTSKGLNLYARNADSSGDESPILLDDDNKDPYDWSSDGRSVLYRRSGDFTGNDIWIGPAAGGSPGRMLLATSFSEVPGNFSPDGRFFVYTSDESGQPEVYVMRVDGSGKTRVSTNGGLFPLWRGDGREIVYLAADRTLMSTSVEAGEALNLSSPRALFRLDIGVTSARMYDVAPDGQRFLAAVPVPSRVPPAFTVVTNWPRLLDGK